MPERCATLDERLRAVRQRMTVAATNHHRDPADIRLIAASKRRSTADVQEAAHLGLTCFGESHWQEAELKIRALNRSDLCLEWHFIGPIQSNKTRQISGLFDMVHSLDTEKTARRLAEQRPDHRSPLRVLVQINISQEPSKRGVALEDADQLVETILNYDRLRLCGLMAIPSPEKHEAVRREAFARLRCLRDRLQQSFAVDLPELSMGMSADLEAAIAEGSTIVRIGTALFGPRPGTDQVGGR